MKKIIRWLSIPTALVAILLIADIILPSSQKDQAIVKSKYISRQGKSNQKAYNIRAEGKFKYNEQIDRDLYEKINSGDTIDVGLSVFFKELKEINLLGHAQVLESYRGTDIYYMGIFGFIFLLPIFISYIIQKYSSRIVFLYCALFIEIIALVILCRILLVLFGALPKV